MINTALLDNQIILVKTERAGRSRKLSGAGRALNCSVEASLWLTSFCLDFLHLFDQAKR